MGGAVARPLRCRWSCLWNHHGSSRIVVSLSTTIETYLFGTSYQGQAFCTLFVPRYELSEPLRLLDLYPARTALSGPEPAQPGIHHHPFSMMRSRCTRLFSSILHVTYRISYNLHANCISLLIGLGYSLNRNMSGMRDTDMVDAKRSGKPGRGGARQLDKSPSDL